MIVLYLYGFGIEQLSNLIGSVTNNELFEETLGEAKKTSGSLTTAAGNGNQMMAPKYMPRSSNRILVNTIRTEWSQLGEICLWACESGLLELLLWFKNEQLHNLQLVPKNQVSLDANPTPKELDPRQWPRNVFSPFFRLLWVRNEVRRGIFASEMLWHGTSTWQVGFYSKYMWINLSLLYVIPLFEWRKLWTSATKKFRHWACRIYLSAKQHMCLEKLREPFLNMSWKQSSSSRPKVHTN